MIDILNKIIGGIIALFGLVIIVTANLTDNSAEIAAANTAAAKETELVAPLTDKHMHRAYVLGTESGSIKNSKAELTGWEKNYLNQVYAQVKQLDEKRHGSTSSTSDTSLHDLGW